MLLQNTFQTGNNGIYVSKKQRLSNNSITILKCKVNIFSIKDKCFLYLWRWWRNLPPIYLNNVASN